MKLPFYLGQRKQKDNERMKMRANREHGFKPLPKIKPVAKGKLDERTDESI
jgi:hypothetical protein